MMTRLISVKFTLLMALFVHLQLVLLQTSGKQLPPTAYVEVTQDGIEMVLSPDLIYSPDFAVQLYNRELNFSCKHINFLYSEFYVSNSLKVKSDFVDCKAHTTTNCNLHYSLNIRGCYCVKVKVKRNGIDKYYHSGPACQSPNKTKRPESGMGTAALSFETIVGVCVCAVLLVFGVVVIYWAYRKAGLRNLLSWRHDNQNGFVALSKSVDVATGTVFVVYHPDCSDHFKTIQEFASVLGKRLNWEVVLTDESIEQICLNGLTGWVSDMINRSNAIVLISSKGAHETVRCYQDYSKKIDNTGKVGNAFLLTWLYITSNYSLQKDYKKIFNVKFDSTPERYILREVVPGRHFNIPADLEQLIEQVRACSQD